jgi:hypothetical protein
VSQLEQIVILRSYGDEESAFRVGEMQQQILRSAQNDNPAIKTEASPSP